MGFALLPGLSGIVGHRIAEMYRRSVMKKKNRTGILTAMLAVLCIQRVELKKKIGIITVLAVMVALTGIAFATENAATDSLRIYGTFGEGAGNHTLLDPSTKLKPENPPYTDPIAPFFPQSNQSPVKDFITFDPIIMLHNDNDFDKNGVYDSVYSRIIINNPNSQTPAEKVFQRMWYEKDWFKDEDKDGMWDVIVEDKNGNLVKTIHLDDFKKFFHDNLPESQEKGWRLREVNNPENNGGDGDVYSPSIIQEFTYMFLDDNKQPTLAPTGSRFYIPMASAVATNGIDSFDADSDGVPDLVQIESQRSLGINIDNRNQEMDPDGKEVSSDENVVLVLADPNEGIHNTLSIGGEVQFFDHKVNFKGTTKVNGVDAAILEISSQEDTAPTGKITAQVIMQSGDVKYFSRGIDNTGKAIQGPFFVKVEAVARGNGPDTVTIQVGRLFGELAANIGANNYWNEKGFIVDNVFYNIVAIKAHSDRTTDTFKYITFRQKLPKDTIKLYGIHMRVWENGDVLAQMPQFNMKHTVMKDVQDTWTHDKMGPIAQKEPLEITWIKEEKEPRFRGELKEIYNETRKAGSGTPGPIGPSTFISSRNVLIVDGVNIGGVTALNPADYMVNGSFDAGVLNITRVPIGSFVSTGSNDTVILFQVNIADMTPAQKTELVNFVNGGGKIIIWDSDAGATTLQPNIYDWLPTNLIFQTSVPGQAGARGGILNITEENDLSSSVNGTPKYINTLALTTSTDAVGDANVVTTNGTDWCEDMHATNILNVSGPGHMYSRVGGSQGKGFITYSALDWDFANFGNGTELNKMIQFELMVNSTSTLACKAPIVPGGSDEIWTIEWFNTMPEQFTEFVLPKGQDYLVTTGFEAPEAKFHLWNNDPKTPIKTWTGDRLKFRHEPQNNFGLYVNEVTGTNGGQSIGSLRLYGTFGEGPGNFEIEDPLTGLDPENKPYTDPVAPFFPQAGEAPRKDHVTFDPIIMLHNDNDFDNNGVIDNVYSRIFIRDANIQTPAEKLFKRMWYEKEWFKDEDKDGEWDVIVEDKNGTKVTKDKNGNSLENPIDLKDWETVFHDNLPKSHHDGWRLREHNNPENDVSGEGDVYGPSVNQEFTFMFLDDNKQPTLVPNGSRFYIPMASAVADNGIDSFDADSDGVPDLVQIESERTLGMDIDNDGIVEKMDPDGKGVSSDESVVLLLADPQEGDHNTLNIGDEVQFFDHKVSFKSTTKVNGIDAAILEIYSQEGSTPTGLKTAEVVLGSGEVKFFSRGMDNTGASVQGPFFVKVEAVARGNGPDTITIKVGRLFGQLSANIGANKYWNQKAFIVDNVFYNVVAIKANSNSDDTFKYITFRQKLPKEPIKLYGVHLRDWKNGEVLPEMPQYNMKHTVMKDVQDTWTHDKMGPLVERNPLGITWIKEEKESRFKGELKEIYWETFVNNTLKEHWTIEWFQTKPDQFTEFILPKEQQYLVTTGFVAPEAVTHIWDNDPVKPIETKIGDRLKFWHDPANAEDIYVNGQAASTPTPTTPTPTPTTTTPQPGTTCQGDINGDGSINSADFVLFASAYNSVSGDSRYNVKADMNNNSEINSQDFVLFAANYGTSCSV